MVNGAVEALGYGLLLAFLWFLWPPLVLLGAGVLLVLWANVSRSDGRSARALGAAWSAARAAYRSHRALNDQTAELRRIA